MRRSFVRSLVGWLVGSFRADAWQLYSADHFTYLNQSGCYTVDGMDDTAEYQAMRVRRLVAALVVVFVLCIDAADRRHPYSMPWALLASRPVIKTPSSACWPVFSTLATSRSTRTRRATPSSPTLKVRRARLSLSLSLSMLSRCSPHRFTVLELAASMFNVEPFALQNAILFRVINTGQQGGRQSTYNVPQNIEQAAYARDAVAKAVYTRLFDYLIGCVNAALSRIKMAASTVIGVLDIFGFEIFEVRIHSLDDDDDDEMILISCGVLCRKTASSNFASTT